MLELLGSMANFTRPGGDVNSGFRITRQHNTKCAGVELAGILVWSEKG